ncbi:MAG: FAD-containing oxidoreductase [Bradymonadaceae bacterium]
MMTSIAINHTSSSVNHKKNWIRIALGLMLVAALIAIIFGPTEEWLTTTTDLIRGMGVSGAVVFAAAYIVATILFIPGSLLTIAAGFLFGLVWGAVLVSAASTLGALAAFFLGRYIARDAVHEKIEDYPRFNAIYRAVGKESFKVILLARLVPVIPYNFLNYAFGLTDASWRKYLTASWLGMIPGTIAYVYIGAVAGSLTQALAADGPPQWMNLGLYALGAVGVLGGSWLLTKRARSELDKIVNEESRESKESAKAVPLERRILSHEAPNVAPADGFNKMLVENTHPPDWSNPTGDGVYNLIAIGAGTAGLVGAAGAASLGARSAIIEKEFMGGDCLVSGCVPSKALLRSSRAIHDARQVGEYGGRLNGEVEVDFPALMERMRRLRAEISEHDAAKRFADMGVDVFFGEARFSSPNTITVGDRELRFKKALIATGASPFIPPINGLDKIDYLTNETIFSLTELPARMAVIGAGPLGCELAQAFARFGAEVTILELSERILPQLDALAATKVRDALERDGVRVLVGTEIQGAETLDGGLKKLIIEYDGSREELEIEEILVATGRKPNVDNLGLDQAGVRFNDKEGIEVDDHMRSSQRHIFAAGDCATMKKFTHVADAQARVVIQNALFFGRKKASSQAVPRVTYTDPECAQVGLTEEQAQEGGVEFDVLRYDFDDLDRAIVDGETGGFVKVLLAKGKDRILGVTLVARHAGDMISEMTLAMEAGVGLGRLSSVIHPYPTQSEAFKKLGDEYNRQRLKPWLKHWLERFFTWRR